MQFLTTFILATSLLVNETNEVGRNLKSIDLENAKRLLYYKCKINLENCNEISNDCLSILATSRYPIALNGLTRLTDEMAEILSYSMASICLDGLKDISPSSLKYLSKCSSSVSLGGITGINLEQAVQLKKFRYLKLNGLKSLDKKAAFEFSKNYTNKVYLNGLNAIETDVLQYLSASRGTFILDGLIDFDYQSVEIIANGNAVFEFGSIRSLSDKIFNRFTECQSTVIFSCITSLTKQQSIEYKNASRNFIIYLNSNSPNEEFVESLLHRNETINLPGIKRLPGKIAKKISGYNLRTVIFPDLIELDPEVSYWLGKCSGSLSLPNLSNIDELCADYISEFIGHLDLKGLKIMPIGIAEKLSGHVGSLDISGVELITDSVSIKLSKHIGSLKLSSVKELSDFSALNLCKIKTPTIFQVFQNCKPSSFFRFFILNLEIKNNEQEFFIYNQYLSNSILFLDGIKNLTIFKISLFTLNNKKLVFNFDAMTNVHFAIYCLSNSFIDYDNFKEPTLFHYFPLLYHRGGINIYNTANLSYLHYFLISKNRGEIYFGPMDKIPEKAVFFLARHNGFISLFDLKFITINQATKLREHSGKILISKRILKTAETSDLVNILSSPPFSLAD